MKIAHLLGWYFPDSVGGTEVYVEGLSRRLLAAGYQVLIAAPDAHGVAAEHYEHDGVPVFRYPIPDHQTRDEAYHRVPLKGAERLHRWLADERPDILHVHSFTAGVGLPEIREARRLGIRVLVTCHLPGLGYMCRNGELMQWGTSPCDGIVIADKCGSCSLTRFGLAQKPAEILGSIPPTLGAALRHLPSKIGTALGMTASVVEYQQKQREVFDLVERFVVLNQTSNRMLVANGSPANKIVINRLGVGQVGMAGKGAPQDRPTSVPVRFGYAGRLHPSKGLTDIVRAVRAIPRDVQFKLEIRGPILDAGARAFVADLRHIIQDDPRMRFEPAVPPADIPAVLADLDVLLCPSRTFENGPTVALEAMAVGTPIIATRVGNLAELVEDGVNGRLVEVGDVGALSCVLADVATNPGNTVDVWRRSLTQPRTMDDVTRDYQVLYAA